MRRAKQHHGAPEQPPIAHEHRWCAVVNGSTSPSVRSSRVGFLDAAVIARRGLATKPTVLDLTIATAVIVYCNDTLRQVANPSPNTP